jgi:hypothetical protein
MALPGGDHPVSLRAAGLPHVIVVYCPGGCTDAEIDAPEQRSAHQPEADDPAAV